MMVKLITPDTIAFKAHITEEDLRKRLTEEVLEQIGGLDVNGKPQLGLKVSVRRGEARVGGYTIEVSGPAPARIMLPPPA